MRHVLRAATMRGVLLLVVHLAAVAYLTGLTWLVQLVVYPSFRTVGPTAAWPAFHDAHARGTAYAVGLPWAAQGATLAALLVDRPRGVPLALVLAAGALGLATVLLTVGRAVPLHGRLQPYDAGFVTQLLRASAWRTAAWTAGLVTAAAMLLTAG